MSYPTPDVSNAEEEKLCSVGICATPEVSQAYSLMYKEYSIQDLANGCNWPSSFIFHCTPQVCLIPPILDCWGHSDHDCHNSCFSLLQGSTLALPVLFTSFFALSPSFFFSISLLVIFYWNTLYLSFRSQFIFPLQILLQHISIHSSLLLERMFLLFKAVDLDVWSPEPWHQPCHHEDLLKMEILMPQHMLPELQTMAIELSSLHFY